MTDAMTLEIPVDPAYAVTARLFVATAARDMGLAEATVDDLRLAASELVANAVETRASGPVRLSLSHEGSDIVIHATGTGTLRDEPPISRRALLETLFDATRIIENEGIRIHVPAPQRSTAGDA